MQRKRDGGLARFCEKKELRKDPICWQVGVQTSKLIAKEQSKSKFSAGWKEKIRIFSYNRGIAA